MSQSRINKSLAFYQKIVLLFMVIGYAVFYLNRNNIDFVFPFFKKNLAITEEQIGAMGSVFTLLYGGSKFFMSILGDKVAPHKMLFWGLLGTAVCNLGIVGAKSFNQLFLFWALVAIFQSMGWPPCTKLIVSWFTKKEQPTIWAVVSMSMQIGNIFASVFAILCNFWGWQAVLVFPALIAGLLAFLVLFLLPVDPLKLGFNLSNAKIATTESNEDLRILPVVRNTKIWFLSLAEFFFAMVRQGSSFWIAYILMTRYGLSLAQSGLQVAVKEFGSLLGGLWAGRLTSKLGINKGPAICGFYIFMLLFDFLYLYFFQFDFFFIFWLGFFLQGPHTLGGVIMVNLVPQSIASSAVGFLGIFYALGSAINNYLTGFFLKNALDFYIIITWVIASFASLAFFLLLALLSSKNKPEFDV